MIESALLYCEFRASIGHGFLVADDLLVTCAHVVGDLDASERPFANPVKVTFQDGRRATGFLHAYGWFPKGDAIPDFSADIAILRLDWASDRPSDLEQVEFVEDCAEDATFFLNVTKKSGANAKPPSRDGSERVWSAPKLTLLSALSPGCEMLEFSPQDPFDPSTEQGWSGAPVIVQTDAGPKVVAMWNGASENQLHRGHAISASLLRRAVDHCKQKRDIWRKRPWRAHPFNDDVRGHPQPHRIEEDNPVSGSVVLRQKSLPSDTAMEQDNADGEIFVSPQCAGVCSLDIHDAGSVRFGIVSARLTVETEHLSVRPRNRVGEGTAWATAQLEGSPRQGDAGQTVRYLITPKRPGDVLMGAPLCGDVAIETVIGDAIARQGANHAPAVRATLAPVFEVIDVFEPEERPSTEDAAEFKKLLLARLMRDYMVNDGVFDLDVADEF